MGTAIPISRQSRRRFRVREYRAGDDVGILALFNRTFARGDPARARDQATWRWLYERCPQGRRISIAEAEDGTIIAHFAAIPLRLQYRGEERIAGHCVDSMVDSDWRGLGPESPFLATARHYFVRFGDPPPNHLNYGFPNRTAMRIGVQALDYLPVHTRFPTVFYNGFENRPLRRLGARGANRRRSTVRSFGDRHDRLWRELRRRYELALVRDAAYLNWRYVDAPHRYEVIEVHDRANTLRAIAVFRRGWSGAPILALVDLLVAPDDVDSLARILRHGADTVRSGEQIRFEAWLPPESPWFRHALRLGMDAEPSPFTIACRLPRTPEAFDWHRSNWYFTIGDSDVF